MLERWDMTIEDIVLTVAKNHISNVARETVIFGIGGELDSLELVSFLVDVETAVEEHCGKQIIIASERAMSQSRSPFASIPNLVDFIESIL